MAEPREVTVPADLADSLAADDVARAAFDRLPPSHRRERVRWVEEAKQAGTRTARIARTPTATSTAVATNALTMSRYVVSMLHVSDATEVPVTAA